MSHSLQTVPLNQDGLSYMIRTGSAAGPAATRTQEVNTSESGSPYETSLLQTKTGVLVVLDGSLSVKLAAADSSSTSLPEQMTEKPSRCDKVTK